MSSRLSWGVTPCLLPVSPIWTFSPRRPQPPMLTIRKTSSQSRRLSGKPKRGKLSGAVQSAVMNMWARSFRTTLSARSASTLRLILKSLSAEEGPANVRFMASNTLPTEAAYEGKSCRRRSADYRISLQEEAAAGVLIASPQAAVSLSSVHAAFAGLVEGRHIASRSIRGSIYFL